MTVLTRVGKRYGRGPMIVEDVNLRLSPGEPVVLLGSNGSGKSTLLRVIAGVSKPTKGNVSDRPPTVGYVPDRFPAQLRFSAADYLRHLQRIRRVESSGDPTELLTALGFHGGMDTPMHRLSKGNAQKVGLVQALASGARLLVLDEPWSGLDTGTRPVLNELLSGTRAALIVTDHTGTAQDLPGQRTHQIHQGRLT